MRRSSKNTGDLGRRLVHVVDLQSPPAVNSAQDVHGVPIDPWTVSATGIRAEVKKQAGTLELQGDQLRQSATWTVTVRADPNIAFTADKRFAWSDRFGSQHYLYIESDLHPQGEREDEIAIACHERPEI